MSITPARRAFVTRSVAALTLATLLAPLAPIVRDVINHGVDTRSGEVATAADASARVVRLPIAASHVSVHWTGAPDANLTLNLGKTPEAMSEDIAIAAESSRALLSL